MCETIIASSTSKSTKCSIIVYSASAFEKVCNRIKTVEHIGYFDKDNFKNGIYLIPIKPVLDVLPPEFEVFENFESFEAQDQQLRKIIINDDNQIEEICNKNKKFKLENTNFHIKHFLKKQVTKQRNQCKVKTQQQIDSVSCVPKVCYNVLGSNCKSIRKYHTGVFSSHVSNNGRNTVIRNICKQEKYETREFLLSKGNEPSLPMDRQSVIDMSKVERHPFATGTTVIITLNPFAFLLKIKKSYNLMKTLIRSSATQAQCARHPLRHKKVGQ